jgi:hypothetical protein
LKAHAPILANCFRACSIESSSLKICFALNFPSALERPALTLERRAQEALNNAQLDAIKAQIEATEYAKQNLTAIRKTVFWTAVAAVGTAVATVVSSLGA